MNARDTWSAELRFVGASCGSWGGGRDGRFGSKVRWKEMGCAGVVMEDRGWV
ncbi:Hypothetical protein A7982_07389 [Minicystis rosea]|nr:Hypothetical protein A7982_07389 [Minicystis rosea]